MPVLINHDGSNTHIYHECKRINKVAVKKKSDLHYCTKSAEVK